MVEGLQLSSIASIGRNFDEYYRLFALADIDPAVENILDVAAGASSFCAEAHQLGYSVTATDRIYNESHGHIEQLCNRDLDRILQQVPANAGMYDWTYFSDIQALERQRRRTCELFLEDFRRFGASRYLPVAYPATPFPDKAFSIALSAGFLFLYDALLDYQFHQQVILELARITTREIRIWPLVNLQGQRPAVFDQLLADQSLRHLHFHTRPIDYAFFKNADEVLIIDLAVE